MARIFQLSASNSAVNEQSGSGALVTQTLCSFRRAIWLILPNRISCAHWPPIDRLPHEGSSRSCTRPSVDHAVSAQAVPYLAREIVHRGFGGLEGIAFRLRVER